MSRAVLGVLVESRCDDTVSVGTFVVVAVWFKRMAETHFVGHKELELSLPWAVFSRYEGDSCFWWDWEGQWLLGRGRGRAEGVRSLLGRREGGMLG